MMMITSPAHRSSRPFSFSACASSCLTCTFLCMSCLISPCRTFMYSALPPCLSFSQMSCHATPSIIERSGEASDGVVETTSCPSSFFIFDNEPLAPSLPCCFCFSSSLILWRERCRRHCLSLFPLVPPCLVSVVSCHSIVSFHG